MRLRPEDFQLREIPIPGPPFFLGSAYPQSGTLLAGPFLGSITPSLFILHKALADHFQRKLTRLLMGYPAAAEPHSPPIPSEDSLGGTPGVHGPGQPMPQTPDPAEDSFSSVEALDDPHADSFSFLDTTYEPRPSNGQDSSFVSGSTGSYVPPKRLPSLA